MTQILRPVLLRMEMEEEEEEMEERRRWRRRMMLLLCLFLPRMRKQRVLKLMDLVEMDSLHLLMMALPVWCCP